MSVAYCAVARLRTGGRPAFLAEYQSRPGGVPRPDVLAVLHKVNTAVAGYTTQTLLRYSCHVLVHKPAGAGATLLFVAVGEPKSLSRQRAHGVLDELRSRAGAAAESATDSDGELPLQAELGGAMKDVAEQTGVPMEQSDEMVDRVRGQVDEVTQVMQDNVNRVLDRGERIDDLHERSVGLEQSSHEFQTTSHRVRQTMCWRSAKWTIVLVVVGALVCTAAILYILHAAGVF